MVSITLRSLSFVVANLILSAPGAISQDLSELPACALSCSQTALEAINKACTATDFACLCKNKDFVHASSQCYTSSCPADQLVKATNFGVSTCAQVGVNITSNAAADAASGAANLTSSIANATSNAASNVAGAAGRLANSTANNSPAISNASASPNRQNSAANAIALSTGTLSLFSCVAALISMLM